jgi:hypothetical protein
MRNVRFVPKRRPSASQQSHVIGEALRHLEKKLQEQNDIYAQKYKDARAERILNFCAMGAMPCSSLITSQSAP